VGLNALRFVVQLAAVGYLVEKVIHKLEENQRAHSNSTAYSAEGLCRGGAGMDVGELGRGLADSVCHLRGSAP
jgi:hypothetical protein